MISKQTLTFLKKLKANNNREWFQENKELYLSAKANMEEVVEKIIKEVQRFDPELKDTTVKKSLFRIYRDVRFGKNKLPYKTNLGAAISKGKKMNMPGYYLHIEPGKSFLAAGIYSPDSKDLSKIRDLIAFKGGDLLRVIKRKSFKDCFGEIKGRQLKVAPRGFPKDHEYVELLRFKEVLVVYPLSDSSIKEENFYKEVIKIFKKALPLNQFLRRAF